MRDFDIPNRWSGDVIVTVKAKDFSAAVKQAIKDGVNLSGSDLSGSNLSNSDLSNSDLSGSDLSGSNLSNSDLSGSNLSNSDLSGSNLRYSNLSNSDLSGSDLSKAKNLDQARLESIKFDFFGRLSVVPNEAEALLEAIESGKIDGSCYVGECCCFAGTIANQKGVLYTEIPGLRPDSSSATELWFTGINAGDTPETNLVSKITAGWVREFIANRERAK